MLASIDAFEAMDVDRSVLEFPAPAMAEEEAERLQLGPERRRRRRGEARLQRVERSLVPLLEEAEQPPSRLAVVIACAGESDPGAPVAGRFQLEGAHHLRVGVEVGEALGRLHRPEHHQPRRQPEQHLLADRRGIARLGGRRVAGLDHVRSRRPGDRHGPALPAFGGRDRRPHLGGRSVDDRLVDQQVGTVRRPLPSRRRRRLRRHERHQQGRDQPVHAPSSFTFRISK